MTTRNTWFLVLALASPAPAAGAQDSWSDQLQDIEKKAGRGPSSDGQASRSGAARSAGQTSGRPLTPVGKGKLGTPMTDQSPAHAASTSGDPGGLRDSAPESAQRRYGRADAVVPLPGAKKAQPPRRPEVTCKHLPIPPEGLSKEDADAINQDMDAQYAFDGAAMDLCVNHPEKQAKYKMWDCDKKDPDYRRCRKYQEIVSMCGLEGFTEDVQRRLDYEKALIDWRRLCTDAAPRNRR